MFKRFAGTINSVRPTNAKAKDYEIFVNDDGTNITLNIWDETNSAWKGHVMTTSTSTSTTTTSTSTTTTL